MNWISFSLLKIFLFLHCFKCPSMNDCRFYSSINIEKFKKVNLSCVTCSVLFYRNLVTCPMERKQRKSDKLPFFKKKITLVCRRVPMAFLCYLTHKGQTETRSPIVCFKTQSSASNYASIPPCFLLLENLIWKGEERWCSMIGISANNVSVVT